jgi:AraC-like DNA-binding protein
MIGAMESFYRQRPSAVPGAVVWERATGPIATRSPILPDGCLDLVWDGDRLFVAGPDTTARWHESKAGAHYTGLRFSGGAGPAVLGVPADVLCDQTVDLDGLLRRTEMGNLLERLQTDPAAALEAWATGRAQVRPLDPLGPRILSMAATGTTVATMAEHLGYSPRQLHRRCLPVFGYGPRRLSRILRLGRALDQARLGVPLAQVAATCGYADQAHFSREVRDLTGSTPASFR